MESRSQKATGGKFLGKRGGENKKEEKADSESTEAASWPEWVNPKHWL